MRIFICIFIILIAVPLAFPESGKVRDGREYGKTGSLFRHKWWNYYERGLSYSEGEFYQEAIEDLQTAINKRKDDNWRSRTYGMHFVNYFPHRELGIIFYRLKRYIEAEKELENSLRTAESSKAKYFLNKARKSILEETGNDKQPPSLKIKYPLDGSVTNKSLITIEAEAEDDYYVSSIRIDSIPVPVELSSKKISFEQALPLKRGRNDIRIILSDLTGKSSEKTVRVFSDREGPFIIIEDQKISAGKVIIDGVITDNMHITSLLINGDTVLLQDEKNKTSSSPSNTAGKLKEFHHEAEIMKGSDIITLRAEDAASNVTKGTMPVNYSTSELNNSHLLALSGHMNSDVKRVEIALIASVLGKITDDSPPIIHVQDISDHQTVYTEVYYLEGYVSDADKVDSLIINGESVLKRKGVRIFFNFLTNLEEGENTLVIEATDISGNKSQKIMTVHRKIPKARKIGSRMSITILPFEVKGRQSIAGTAVFNSLISAFVHQKRFQLIEREKIEDVLSELRLGQTDLVEPGTASRIGKIVASDAILTGTVFESQDSIEVLTRIIDTETSNIMEAKDVFDEDKSLHGVKGLMEGLALKYKQSFPLVEGLIIRKEGKDVFTDLGEDKSIKRNMGLILFREGDQLIHPVTERNLGAVPEELGEAKIETVFNEYSRANLKRGNPAKIKIKDKVITK